MRTSLRILVAAALLLPAATASVRADELPVRVMLAATTNPDVSLPPGAMDDLLASLRDRLGRQASTFIVLPSDEGQDAASQALADAWLRKRHFDPRSIPRKGRALAPTHVLVLVVGAIVPEIYTMKMELVGIEHETVIASHYLRPLALGQPEQWSAAVADLERQTVSHILGSRTIKRLLIASTVATVAATGAMVWQSAERRQAEDATIRSVAQQHQTSYERAATIQTTSWVIAASAVATAGVLWLDRRSNHRNRAQLGVRLDPAERGVAVIASVALP